MTRLRLPPPVIALITGWAIYSLHKYGVGPQLSVPFQAYIAVCIIAAGVLIEGASILAFFKAKTTVNPLRPHKASTLVVSGMNRISRNPMYLGMLLLLIGFTVYLGAATGFAPLILFVAYITYFQIKPEERALLYLFGDAYKDYQASVRRWI